jgi:hypothetical protein
MEEHMGERDILEISPRRSFFGRVAAMAALGLSGLVPTAVRAQTAVEEDDGPNWPGPLKGRHKQVFDVAEFNDGFPLGFTNNFLTPNKSATAVLIFRHTALPMGVNHAIWAKYKLGEALKINDPETKAPAVKNPWYQPKAGVLRSDEMAIDRLLARGSVAGACNVALRGQSRRFASNAGVTPDEAYKEWAANMIPGVTIIPSGTWGVNRAQEAGCTYCAGG